MSDIEQKWFKRDFWTHKEAACLFHGMNPDPDTLHVVFDPTRQNKALNRRIFESLEIFECSDWNQVNDSNSDQERRNYNDYFKVAELKGIRVSQQLLDVKSQFEQDAENRRKIMGKKPPDSDNTANQSEIPIPKKMHDVLKPIITIIQDFENSKEYKKHGTKIQQQLIDNWLESQGLNARIRDHLKKLITEYYGVTTARK